MVPTKNGLSSPSSFAGTKVRKNEVEPTPRQGGQKSAKTLSQNDAGYYGYPAWRFFSAMPGITDTRHDYLNFE
jgi:hypothetical protein